MTDKTFFEMIDYSVEKIKNTNKKLILYPYGKRGICAEQYMYEKYNMVPDLILDNNKFKTDNRIKNLEYLNEIDTEKYVVLITSDNMKIFNEIRLEIRKYISLENIYDICWKVLTNIDPRVESLRLIAENICNIQLEGSVAEVGVYKGDFAKYINRFFPDKQLYLFDTFEGFKNEKLKECVDERFKKEVIAVYPGTREDIDTDMMLRNFDKPEVCNICKGFFPDTAEVAENEKFCFVNLDVDLYQGTMDGLEFFYPRLVRRGMIMIHDYNTHNCLGVRRAVDEFCEKNQIALVCIPDECGSVVITKN